MILQEINNLIFEMSRWKKQALLTHGGTKILGKSINPNKAIYGQSRLSKDALQKLEDVGIKKSYDSYIKGFNAGTYNKAKSANSKITIDNNSKSNTSGFDIERMTGSNANNLPMQISLNRKAINNPLISRHEADEAVETKRIMRKVPHTDMSTSLTHFTKKGELQGIHASEKILQNEAKNRQMLYSLYGDKIRPINKEHDIYRKNSGEYSDKILKTKTKDIDKRFAQNNISRDQLLTNMDPVTKSRLSTLQSRSSRVADYFNNQVEAGKKMSDVIQRIRPVQSKLSKKISNIIDQPKYEPISRVAKVETT